MEWRIVPRRKLVHRLDFAKREFSSPAVSMLQVEAKEERRSARSSADWASSIVSPVEASSLATKLNESKLEMDKCRIVARRRTGMRFPFGNLFVTTMDGLIDRREKCVQIFSIVDL